MSFSPIAFGLCVDAYLVRRLILGAPVLFDDFLVDKDLIFKGLQKASSVKTRFVQSEIGAFEGAIQIPLLPESQMKEIFYRQQETLSARLVQYYRVDEKSALKRYFDERIRFCVVRSLAERRKIVDFLGNGRLIYRGQANVDWRLQPSIFRDERLSNEPSWRSGGEDAAFRAIRKFESFYFNKFKFGFPYPFEPFEKIAFRVYSHAQHYGLATRLLDWSKDPNVAMFFAVEDEEEQNADATIACCSPGSLTAELETALAKFAPGLKIRAAGGDYVDANGEFFLETLRYLLGAPNERPVWLRPEMGKYLRAVPVEPNEVEARMRAQSGVFTAGLWTGRIEEAINADQLYYLLIPKERKATILAELGAPEINVTRKTIYPDWTQLVAELNEKRRSS